MLASKTTLLLRLCIYIKPTSPLPKQSTILYSSQVLRLNFLPWDVTSTRHATKTTSQKSSLSLILFTQQNTSLIVRRTYFNCIQQPSLVNCNFSSTKVRTIPLSFGNVLVISSGGFTKMSTKIPSCSIQLLYSLVKSHGIFAENW